MGYSLLSNGIQNRYIYIYIIRLEQDNVATARESSLTAFHACRLIDIHIALVRLRLKLEVELLSSSEWVMVEMVLPEWMSSAALLLAIASHILTAVIL